MSEDFILTGERAALGPLKRDHLPMFARWINDPEVRRGLAYHHFSRAELGIFLGRRRDAVNVLGRRWDSLLMDAVASDFDSPVLEALRPER